ncbi:hypothetical protein M2153_001462 [Pseudomonas sp. JUb96]|nr:hypothetical protein [Pseudomonas sp. JUb96]
MNNTAQHDPQDLLKLLAALMRAVRKNADAA